MDSSTATLIPVLYFDLQYVPVERQNPHSSKKSAVPIGMHIMSQAHDAATFSLIT